MILKPKKTVSEICDAIRELQRQRVCCLKSRIMVDNRLVATVATTRGYHAGMDEDDRKLRFKEAAELIAAVRADEGEDDSVSGLIQATGVAIDGFDAMVKGYEREMVRLVKGLPIVAWVNERDQRGFGLPNLAIIIGEAGNLSNYANPAKLWKRLGCAPFEKNGVSQMPSTWRSKKGLSSEEWESIGYSPRRRSVAYNVGEPLIKSNRTTDKETEEVTWTGPYRARYDQAKATIQAAHPDYPKMRCHRHGMLLATKLLLKNLWIAWTDAVGSYGSDSMAG